MSRVMGNGPHRMLLLASVADVVTVVVSAAVGVDIHLYTAVGVDIHLYTWALVHDSTTWC